MPPTSAEARPAPGVGALPYLPDADLELLLLIRASLVAVMAHFVE